MTIEEKIDQPLIALPRVGKVAPFFIVKGNVIAYGLDDFYGRWLLLLSQPESATLSADADFIKSIEIYPELRKQNVAVLCLSVGKDAAIMRRPLDMPGDLGVTTPPVLEGQVSRETMLAYGRTWMGEGTKPGRSVFIIDDQQIVKAILYLPLPTNGRMHQVLNIMLGLQTTYAPVVSSRIWTSQPYG